MDMMRAGAWGFGVEVVEDSGLEEWEGCGWVEGG
jgi:hypothetical protein